MVEQEQINKLLGRPDHLINQSPIDHRLMSQISHNYNQQQSQLKMQNSFNALDDYLLRNSNKGDAGFLLKSHDKFSSPGMSPIKGVNNRNHDDMVIPTHQNGRKKGAPSEFFDESAF